MLTEPTSAGSAALVRTLAGNLDDAQVSLTVRRADDVPLERLAPLTDAGPVVVVDWRSPRRATLRAALRPREWTSRSLEFGAKDPLTERARTLGFAAAAIFPHWRPAQPSASPQTPEVTPLVLAPPPPPTMDDAAPPPPPPLPIEAPPPPEPVATPSPVEVPPAPAPVATPPPVEAAPAPALTATSDAPPTARRFRVGLVLAGNAPWLGGGGLQGAWCPTRWLCAGLEGTALAGPLSLADSTRLEVRVAAFVEARVPLASVVQPVARAAGALTWLTVRRGDEALARWLGQGTLEAGGLWSPRDARLDVTLTGGVTLSPPTTVLVRGDTVAEVPWLQGHLRLGVAFHL